jgi:hypothetical protein
MSAVNVLQYVGQQVRWQLPLPGLLPAVVSVAVVAIVIWVNIWVVMTATIVVLRKLGAGVAELAMMFGGGFLQST